MSKKEENNSARIGFQISWDQSTALFSSEEISKKISRALKDRMKSLGIPPTDDFPQGLGGGFNLFLEFAIDIYNNYTVIFEAIGKVPFLLPALKKLTLMTAYLINHLRFKYLSFRYGTKDLTPKLSVEIRALTNCDGLIEENSMKFQEVKTSTYEVLSLMPTIDKVISDVIVGISIQYHITCRDMGDENVGIRLTYYRNQPKYRNALKKLLLKLNGKVTTLSFSFYSSKLLKRIHVSDNQAKVIW